MAIGWNKKSIIGSPIEQPVLQQLQKRKNIFAKKLRDDDDIRYLNANSIWIRLMSSVDTLTGTDLQGNPQYSNLLAKNNVLLNGTLTNKGKQRYGAPTSMEPSEQRGDEAYDVTLPDGTVPMPGITGFQVESKNTFGTVRLAKIEFSVHSGDQLSVLESLFMRPGYEVLLEWGHTVYIDDKGVITTRATKVSSDYFFTANGSHTGIQNALDTIKKSTDFNTDGMFGRVSNFAWQINGGSYDCSIDIMSNGDLLESVAMNLGNAKPELVSEDGAKVTEKEQLFNGTPMHQWLGIIKYAKKYSSKTIQQSIYSQLYAKMFGMTTWVDDFLYNTNTTGIPGESDYDESQDVRHRTLHHICSTARVNSNGTPFRYLPLAEVLELLNYVFLPKRLIGTRQKENIVKFWTGDLANRKEPRTPFLTFPEHVSLDMGVAILPKLKKTDYVYAISTQFIDAQSNGQIDDILNIYVNVDYLLSLMSKHITSTVENASSVLNLVRALIGGIQHTLGDVNKFDITFEEETSTYYIVDRKIVPGKELIKLDSKIDIVGIGSTAEEIQITSKLSSAIATTVAISAQATQSDAGEDMLNLQKWNSGLINRHKTEQHVGKRSKEELGQKPKVPEDFDERLKKFIKTQSSLPALRSKAAATTEGEDTAEEIDGVVMDYVATEIQYLIPAHKTLMQKFAGIATRTKKFNPPGLIPIELSFSMKGISDIKIGQAFVLANEQILPERYRGNVGFMITGVSHSATGNRWMTALKTQMIIISSFEEDIPETEEDIPEVRKEEKQEETPYTPPANPSTRQSPSSLEISDNGLAKIKKDEGFRAKAYRDPGSGDQPITIGYGTTRIDGKAVKLGDTISEPQASGLMKRQIKNIYGAEVTKKVKVDLTQNEYDALVSFTYNVGVGNFRASTLLKKINQKDYIAAADQFLRWDKADGQVMRGLTKRRKEERELFLKDNPGNPA